MSARLARTADGWWAVTPAGLVRLDLPAATTAQLLADRTALDQAIQAAHAAAAATPQEALPASSLQLLSPSRPGGLATARSADLRPNWSAGSAPGKHAQGSEARHDDGCTA